MKINTIIEFSNVSKKFTRSLNQLIKYGIIDISKNILGINTQPEKLRLKEFWAVKNVSFNIRKGETLGIIGPNGSGKTTLLRMINGIMLPDIGQIKINGRVGALIEVGAGFHPMLTGRENIYVNGTILGMTKKEINQKFQDIVEFADIGDFLDAPVKSYSSGMYVRLGFAVAIHAEPDILLIDEILAVGDEGFQNKCLNKIGQLRKNGMTTVLVSHNMHSISIYCNSVLLVEKGKAKLYSSVGKAVTDYRKLFFKKECVAPEIICTGNEEVSFYELKIDNNRLSPGDNLSIVLEYDSKITLNDIEIDTAIICGNDSSLYFQATNKTYRQRVKLKPGKHKLRLVIEKISLNLSQAKVAISIWKKDREEMLYWVRVPVYFKGIKYSTGRNYFNIKYIT